MDSKFFTTGSVNYTPGLTAGPGGSFDLTSTWMAVIGGWGGNGGGYSAGSTSSGYSDGLGSAARFQGAGALCCDLLGNAYVCDNNRVRKVTPAGNVTTLAGGNVTGFADGPGGSATFGTLTGICVSPQGVVYVSDSTNNAIRKIVQTNPYPTFKLTSPTPDGQGGMAVSWPTVTGVKYQVPYSTDLINWQNLGVVVGGDGTTKTINDDTILGNPGRFYHVVVVTP